MALELPVGSAVRAGFPYRGFKATDSLLHGKIREQLSIATIQKIIRAIDRALEQLSFYSEATLITNFDRSILFTTPLMGYFDTSSYVFEDLAHSTRELEKAKKQLSEKCHDILSRVLQKGFHTFFCKLFVSQHAEIAANPGLVPKEAIRNYLMILRAAKDKKAYIAAQTAYNVSSDNSNATALVTGIKVIAAELAVERSCCWCFC